MCPPRTRCKVQLPNSPQQAGRRLEAGRKEKQSQRYSAQKKKAERNPRRANVKAEPPTYSKASWWYPELHIPVGREGARVTLRPCHVTLHSNSKHRQRSQRVSNSERKKNRTWQWRCCAEETETWTGFRAQEIECGAWTERIVSGFDSKVAPAGGGINSKVLSHLAGMRSRVHNKLTELFLFDTHISSWWSRQPRRTLGKKQNRQTIRAMKNDRHTPRQMSGFIWQIKSVWIDLGWRSTFRKKSFYFWGFFGKPPSHVTANQIPTITEATATPTHSPSSCNNLWISQKFTTAGSVSSFSL